MAHSPETVNLGPIYREKFYDVFGKDTKTSEEIIRIVRAGIQSQQTTDGTQADVASYLRTEKIPGPLDELAALGYMGVRVGGIGDENGS